MFLKTLFSLFEKLFRHKKQNVMLTFLPNWEIFFFASIDSKKSEQTKMFFARVDISEIVFYTIFLKFSKWVTKFEDYDKIRSLDGILQ